MKKLLALSAVGVLAFAACGDDDDDDGGDTTVPEAVTDVSEAVDDAAADVTPPPTSPTRSKTPRRKSAKPSTPPPARPRAEPLTLLTTATASPGSGRAVAVARPDPPAGVAGNAVNVQAISRRAMTFRHNVSSAPSKIDSTRASRYKRLTANSSA